MGNISFKEYSIFVLAKYGLISRVWTFQFTQDRASGPSEPGFCFGLIWRGLGVAWSPPFL